MHKQDAVVSPLELLNRTINEVKSSVATRQQTVATNSKHISSLATQVKGISCEVRHSSALIQGIESFLSVFAPDDYDTARMAKIDGIPYVPGEDLMDILQALFIAIKFNYQADQCFRIFRVDDKRAKMTPGNRALIYVLFKNVGIKNLFVKTKIKADITTAADLSLPALAGNTAPIYVRNCTFPRVQELYLSIVPYLSKLTQFKVTCNSMLVAISGGPLQYTLKIKKVRDQKRAFEVIKRALAASSVPAQASKQGASSNNNISRARSQNAPSGIVQKLILDDSYQMET